MKTSIGFNRGRMISGFVAIILAATPCGAGEAKPSQNGVASPPAVKTEFVEDGKLSEAEVNEVVSLALQCGIPDVAKIETFHYLPGGGRGIRAKSKERVAGRTIAYDTVRIGRTDWGGFRRDANAKLVGPFWVNPPFKTTTVLREFDINKNKVRISLGAGVDEAFADKVIPLIAAKKVRFQGSDWSAREFDQLDISKATSLSRNSSGDGYGLWFSTMQILKFKVEKDVIFITGIAHYAI